MKGKMKFAVMFIAFAMLFAMSTPAYAQDSQCLTSVSGSASASTVTTGTDFTISVTPSSSSSGSSCQISTLSLSGSPSSYTISDPPSSQDNQYSGTTAGTTKSFTVSVGTAGTYEFTPTGTTTSGSVSGTAIIVEAVDPSTLTATATPTSAQVNLSGAFTLDMNIEGSTSSDVTTSYTLTVPSGLTRTGDAASSTSTSITANGSYALSWTINHSTCFTGSKTITFALGDNSAASSITVTGNSSCASGTSSSSGGSGGDGGASSNTTTVKKVTLVVSSIAANGIYKIDNEASLKTDGTMVRQLLVKVKNAVSSVKIAIENTGTSRPSSASTAPPGDEVFTYLDITPVNLLDSNIASASFNLQLDKSWVTVYNIDMDTIQAYRYSGGSWNALKTTQTEENSTHYTYMVETPGFSVFAVTGNKIATAGDGTDGVTDDGGQEEGAPPAEEVAGEQPAAGTAPGTPIEISSEILATLLVIIIAVVLFIVYHFFFAGKEKNKYNYQKKYGK